MEFRNLLPFLAAPLLFAMPATAQNIPGKLLNEPSRLDWDTQGKDFTKHGITGADIPGGQAAAHYTIARKGQNPYDITVNVPIVDSIAKGDDVTMGFWARTITADTPDGNGTIGVRVQMNAAPYSGFDDKAFTIIKNWKWYETTGQATVSLSKGQAFATLQLAGARQTIEIGQVIVVKGAKAIAPGETAAAATAAAELPPQLAGKGRLVNHPENRDWGFAGPATAHVDQADKTIFGGKSTRFTSPSVGTNAWDISTQIPIGEAIAEGDHLLIAIAAKTISAQTDDGKALVKLRLQDNTPPNYPGYADAAIKPGPNWQLIQLRVSMSDAIAADRAVLALHFAGAQQVVDIGPVYILKETPPVK